LRCRWTLLEEGVGVALFADGGVRPMAGNYRGRIRQGQQPVVDGLEQRAGVAAGKVGAANRSREQRVAGEQQILLRQVEADAALGVAGRVPG
jgi:hypothetical protein